MFGASSQGAYLSRYASPVLASLLRHWGSVDLTRSFYGPSPEVAGTQADTTPAFRPCFILEQRTTLGGKHPAARELWRIPAGIQVHI